MTSAVPGLVLGMATIEVDAQVERNMLLANSRGLIV